MPENPTHTQLINESRAALLRALDEFAGGLGYNRGAAIDAMRNAAEDAFDEFAGLRGKRGFETAMGFTASSISLVDDDALNFSLELAELTRQLHEHSEVLLGRLHLRFMTLLGRDKLGKELPVGPEAIARALKGLADGAGLDARERASLVSHFEENLAPHLDAFYRTLDERLANAGIETSTLVRPAPSPTRTWNNRSAQAVEHADGASSTQSQQSRAADMPATPLEGLRRALLQNRTRGHSKATEGAYTIDPQLASSILEQIRVWLADRKLSGGETTVRLGASNLGQLLAPATAAAVETLEHVFAQIAGNHAIPDPIRRLIGLLQAPYLGLALDDETLLSDAEHPALKLIDSLAEAGNTLPLENPDHPGFDVLEALVNDLVHAPTLTRADLEPVLDKVKAFITDRIDTATALGSTAQPLAERAAQREAARLLASRALAVLIDDDTPPAVRNFLTGPWLKTLVNTVYRLGQKHPDWREQLGLAHELALATASRNPERVRELTPDIMKGLASAGFDEIARHAVFSPCLAAAQAGSTDVTDEAAPASSLVISEARERPGLMMLHHDGFASQQSARGELRTALEVGTWVEFECDPAGSVLGYITWGGQGNKAVTIADPDSKRVFIATRRSLAELLGEHKFRQRNQPSQVEQAAHAALAGISA